MQVRLECFSADCYSGVSSTAVYFCWRTQLPQRHWIYKEPGMTQSVYWISPDLNTQWNVVPLLTGEKYSSLFQRVPTGPQVSTHLGGILDSFLGATGACNWPLILPSAEVRSEWNYISYLPYVCTTYIRTNSLLFLGNFNANVLVTWRFCTMLGLKYFLRKLKLVNRHSPCIRPERMSKIMETTCIT
jgi:hypothetical protein